MKHEEIMIFEDVLKTIGDKSLRAWVYLPKDRNWSLHSTSAVLESEEVPPEFEDEPDAGMPEFAKRTNLIRVLPVAVLQEVVSNARAQISDATFEELFRAFEYYYENDAFIELI
jgi:hypothetical protein